MKRGYILKNLKNGMYYSNENNIHWTNNYQDAYFFEENNFLDIEKMLDEEFMKNITCEILTIIKGKELC